MSPVNECLSTSEMKLNVTKGQAGCGPWQLDTPYVHARIIGFSETRLTCLFIWQVWAQNCGVFPIATYISNGRNMLVILVFS